ncbi:MAG: UDP-glucose--hexose-1-phosphate uridylyltransferase [Chloroflexaceae bacterium]|nr:UDP-glucose--hexose-1-phosphate uridylyltransferase [Chloroflexaceae bacterium]NJO05927.1 UDP-glucose--hexose-1-phosphate uridylyltransferase [Chloroflexaceae bacterium]
MSIESFTHLPHRRRNLLTGEWVLVSPQRTQRPWQGQTETPPADHLPAYDPTCYLCPGNARAGGKQNPSYTSTFVFENDFPALRPDTSPQHTERGSLLEATSERGMCRVVCFSPRHDLTLADMDVPAIRAVVDLWVAQFEELGALPWVQSVQIFENRGAMMGSSNPHPHGQIWANECLPNELVKELTQQRTYYQQHGRPLLIDYLELELERGERVVGQNEQFVVLVPFWAVWPFEALLLPRRHCTSLAELTDDERTALAAILKQLTSGYNRLFQVSFPYSMGFHQPPTDGAAYPEWHLHAHFYPPLLRSATVRKFMVGYELLAQPQRDITAEQAAERLRDVMR